MCSGFKPKARFYGLLGLKNRHFYAVPGTAGKSSSADISRGSPKAPENSRITAALFLIYIPQTPDGLEDFKTWTVVPI